MHAAHARVRSGTVTRLAIPATILLSPAALPLALADDPPPQTVLVFEHAGLDRMLVDEKDRALVAALGMIPARVAELPRQFPGVQEHVPALLNLLLTTIARPTRLVVQYNGENPTGGAFGYGLAVSFAADDEKDADAIHATVGAMLAAAPQQLPLRPSTRWEKMTDLQLPFGLLSYGPRHGQDGWRYEVVFGSIDRMEDSLPALPGPRADVEPLARGRLDLAGLNPLVEMLAGFAANNPETTETIAQLERAHLVGADAMKLAFQAGYTRTMGVKWLTIENAKSVGDALSLATEPLTPRDLAVVPGDASFVSMTRFATGMFDEVLAEARRAGAPVDDMLAQFQAMTGVHLVDDVLHTLGDRCFVYLSDATGGGSIGSAVAMVSVRDAARLGGAHHKLVTFANRSIDQKFPLGPGYVRLTPWTHGDLQLFSVRCNGLPVPLEVSWALTDSWLIVGATPQAVIAAATQAAGRGDDGLGTNKDFRSIMPDGRAATSLTYIDSPRLIRRAYPLMSMVGSGFANAVRSASGDSRDPGMIVPTYNDLVRGARRSLTLGYWEGEHYVVEMRGDRSALVNAGGVLGAGATLLPLLAIPAAAAAREQGGLGMLVPAWLDEETALVQAFVPWAAPTRGLAWPALAAAGMESLPLRAGAPRQRSMFLPGLATE